MRKTVYTFMQNFPVEKNNLSFYPEQTLIDLSSSQYSFENRICCIAELFRRCFLTRDEHLAEEIDKLLPGGERAALERRISYLLHEPAREELQGELWRSADPFSQKCLVAVRNMLIRLCCDTDGFIPVFSGDQAFLIPFQFREGPAEIRDISGEIIESWSSPYRQVLKDGPAYTCVVQCCQKGLHELTGNSLMLPVLLAYWRKQGLIRYNHLRLLSTGAIENNILMPVETEKKSQAVAVCFPDACFFFPEGSKYYSTNPKEIPLPAGLTLEQLQKDILRHIEVQGLMIPTLRDALARLPQLAEERENTHNSWEELFKRVDLYEKSITHLINPEEYMLCLMLKSSILCHMGKTEEALKLNREAQEFAIENGLEKSLCRMEIEELVELQDKEKFEEISRLSVSLHRNIEQLAEPDLLMRYYGTMGQAHCYGFLSGIADFSSGVGLDYFRKAVFFAGKIGDAPDIAQDLNYYYLWYALFEPDSAEAAKAEKTAEQHILHNLQGDENTKIRQKNLYFFNRIRAFARYRALLKNGQPPEEDPQVLLLPDNAYFWLRGTVCKYAAALYAANGQHIEAEKLFDEAIALLDKPAPIIDFIRLSALAEAYRSLKKDRYRTEALALAQTLKAEYPSAEKWEHFLETGENFPGLNYWY